VRFMILGVEPGGRTCREGQGKTSKSLIGSIDLHLRSETKKNKEMIKSHGPSQVIHS
jgi:hypothetical protein